MEKENIKFLETIYNFMYKEIPYQVYIVLAIFALAAVVQASYDYSNQEEPINFSIDISGLEEDNNMGEVYQGPVPLGYDEEYFRKTGITIKEVEK